jgi:hypothetical protein
MKLGVYDEGLVTGLIACLAGFLVLLGCLRTLEALDDQNLIWTTAILFMVGGVFLCMAGIYIVVASLVMFMLDFIFSLFE